MWTSSWRLLLSFKKTCSENVNKSLKSTIVSIRYQCKLFIGFKKKKLKYVYCSATPNRNYSALKKIIFKIAPRIVIGTS